MRMLNKSLTESVFSALNEDLKGKEFTIEYWADELAREEGYGELEYITAKDVEDAIAKTREMYYDNYWASCELFDGEDEDNQSPLFGMYPEGKKVTEERFDGKLQEKVKMNDVKSLIWSCLKSSDTVTINDVVNSSDGKFNYDDVVSAAKSLENGGYVSFNENDELITKIMNESVTVTAGSTYVTVDETGVTVDDNGTSITVDGGAVVNIENNAIVPEAPVDDMEVAPEEVAPEEVVEPVDGELPIENEEPVDETPSEGEEDIIEPSEELIEPEKEEEDELEESIGDPNNTVEIYKNPEFDYKINDITELDNVDVGDVRSIDMFSILNDLEESLVERYGTEKWGLINPFLTRQGKHKKTNESYASAILDISIPKTDKLQELNTVLAVEVYGDKALKECVVKDARFNKRIERFCGKTKNPVSFLESVMVDLINNRSEIDVVSYQPMTEDTKALKEEVADEAYEIAEIIDKNAEARTQKNDKGDEILRRDDFDEEFVLACEKVFNLSDEEKDTFWEGNFLADRYKDHPYSGCDDPNELEMTVRGILSYKGWETIFEDDDERDFCEGDLVIRNWDEPVNEEVELLVNEPYDDKGMNFADGRAIEKDVKRQQNHLKQHKSLGKVSGKKFDVGKEPDQKLTQGKKVEDITDTVKVGEQGDGKEKKSPSKGKKKKVEESMDEDADRVVLKPVENFDYIDPYGVYYKDDNGNLYKSVNNGNELYICTKAGEPLKDVNPEKYILGDQALNEEHDAPANLDALVRSEIEKNGGRLPDVITYKGKEYQCFNVMSHEESGDQSLVYYCNMANTPSGDPQESNDYFFVNTSLALNPDGNGFKGVREVNYVEDLTESCKKLKEAVAKDKYTLAGCKKAIEEIDSKDGFYDKVRDIIGYNDEEWNEWHGWEDHEIKELQRVADGRYEELSGNINESVSLIKEAKGLLDDEDDTPEDDSEDLVDVDDELEEGATEVAIFHRKPKSLEDMKKAEANGITVNKSNYKVIGHKELSPEEFDDFAKHLSDGKYSWLQDMYNKVSKSDTGMFNCIEVTNAGDSSTSLLVDPNGYDYARFAAIKEDLAETPEENIEEEPIEEPSEESKE